MDAADEIDRVRRRQLNWLLKHALNQTFYPTTHSYEGDVDHVAKDCRNVR